MSDRITIIPAIRPISYRSIEEREVVTVNGQQIIDFTTPMFGHSVPMEYDPNLVQISKELEGKPHLLALGLGNSEDDADAILAYNYVSNPFSIDSSMVFVAPNFYTVNSDVERTKKKYQRFSVIKKNDNLSQAELNKRINNKDKRRLLELMRQTNPDRYAAVTAQIGRPVNKDKISDGFVDVSTGKTITLDEALSRIDVAKTPNMTTDNQIKKYDGKIVFGTNVSNVRCSGKITPTQGKTEIIRKSVRSLIRSKMI